MLFYFLALHIFYLFYLPISRSWIPLPKNEGTLIGSLVRWISYYLLWFSPFLLLLFFYVNFNSVTCIYLPTRPTTECHECTEYGTKLGDHRVLRYSNLWSLPLKFLVSQLPKSFLKWLLKVSIILLSFRRWQLHLIKSIYAFH